MAKSLNCWNCGHGLDAIPRPISRHANCPKCYAELHCCRLCAHFAPQRPGQCDDERTDPPVKKDTANFCDYFRPTSVASAGALDKDATARSKLDALFGKQASADSPATTNDADESNTAPPKEMTREERAKAEFEKLFRR